MKTKIMLVTAMVVLTMAGHAQSKTTFGLRSGINFYNINGKDANGRKYDGNLKPGFNIGVNAEVPIGIDFYVQPGVLFTTKGAKDIYTGNDKLTLSYIEVPVNLLYKPSLGTGRLILGFGPYIAFGAGGKYKYGNNGELDVRFKNDITTAEFISNSTLYYKTIDAGANLLFGYEMTNNISVQLNAGLGLTNNSPKVNGSEDGIGTTKNTGFGISVGYRFK